MPRKNTPKTPATTTPTTAPAARPRIARPRASRTATVVPITPDTVTLLDAPVAPAIADAAWPTQEQIALAAYHRFLARGGQHGSDFEDWIAAEQELLARLRTSSAA